MSNKIEFTGSCLGVIFVFAIVACFVGGVIMLLYNTLVPMFFSGAHIPQEISLWQGLVIGVVLNWIRRLFTSKKAD